MALDDRKGRILQAIVEDYVETIDPIGSEWLVSHYDFGCKSATIRNEMAEMSDLGYLRQPHTSSGRIPSDLGYRYFVDKLMPQPRDRHSGGIRAAERSSSSAVDEIVQQTCRVLAGMTRYPSIATPPSGKSERLHRLFLSQASATHVLLVMLLSSGGIEHRVVEVGPAMNPRSLERASNFLNHVLSGIELGELAARPLGLIPTDVAPVKPAIEKIHSALVEACRSLGEDRVFLEGASQFLRQPEFKDVVRLEQLLSALEQGSVLYQVFSRALAEDEVTVIIGEETSVEAMRDCSVVTSSYRIGGRVGGFIGIVGPTRMHYERAVGAVGLMARGLSEMLTMQSLA